MLWAPMSRPDPAPHGPIPTVQAMLICERIITDGETSMKTLVNVFDIVRIPRPSQSPPAGLRFSLFARLYDAAGNYTFRVDFVYAESERMIAQFATEPTNVPDPLAAADVALAFPPLPLPELGRYEFRLYANDVYLTHVGIRVLAQGE